MQLIPLKSLSGTWLKASVVGSIWAAVEIILGSFLHNLKIPLSGMFLSFISVWLLIAFLQVWKENGLVWRAGLICALMKSISPSAFILGPMIGIFTEAILIELFIFIFGKNLFGYLIGGAFAVLSTILHKLVSLLILYGFDFIKILSDLYLFAIRQINLEHLNPGFLLILISVIYIITGMTGSVAGYLTGLKYLRTKSISDNIYEVTLESGNQLPEPVEEKGYSLILLTFNLISIAGILLLINLNYIIASAILSVFYISYCIIKYKNSLKRLGKITFWISFIIITFAAAFLWNGFSHSAFFSTDGLIIGLKMNARAIIIVIGFASLSVELKNPIIKTILYNRGFASLYQSLNLAFSALPFFLSNISVRSKKKKRMSSKTIHGILGQAESLLNKFEKDHLVKPEIIIVTGEIHQGKTSFTQKIVFDLLYQKIRIAGFVSIGIVKDGTRTGFNLAEIGSSRQVELCSDRKDDKGPKLGRFYFNQEALAFGNEILNPHNLSDKQLIVIDEIGPLEIKGLGWSEAIDKSTRSVLIPQLWVVRKSLVQKIIRKWNIGNVYIFDITEDSISEVEMHIIEILSKPEPINGNKQ